MSNTHTHPILPIRQVFERMTESSRPRQGQSAVPTEREQSGAGYINRGEVKRLQRFATRYGASLEDFGPGLASFPHLKCLQAAQAKAANQGAVAFEGFGDHGAGKRSKVMNGITQVPGDGVVGDHHGGRRNMSPDVLNTQWKKICGHAKQWWGELTDDDLDEIAGKRERLAGIIEKRYGRTREEAEVDINRFLIRVTSLLKLNQRKDVSNS